jgi:hypothetical protein
MPAVHIIGAQQQQADKAGQTYAGQNTRTGTGTTRAGLAPADVVTALMHQAGGDLSSIWSGGTHPELAMSPIPVGGVPTEISKATDSVEGRLGGMKAAPGSVVQPGPAGRAAGAAGRARAAIDRLV